MNILHEISTVATWGLFHWVKGSTAARMRVNPMLVAVPFSQTLWSNAVYTQVVLSFMLFIVTCHNHCTTPLATICYFGLFFTDYMYQCGCLTQDSLI